MDITTANKQIKRENAVLCYYSMVQILTMQKYKAQNDKTNDFVSETKKIIKLNAEANPKLQHSNTPFPFEKYFNSSEVTTSPGISAKPTIKSIRLEETPQGRKN